MKTYSKSIEQRVDRSAMESGDHSKNGASPKSLMSRGNKNMVLLGFIVLSAWLMQSCGATSGLNVGYSMLPDNNSYSVFELRQDYPPVKKFSLGTSLAIGKIEQPKDDRDKESIVSVGVIPMYCFSLNRWQPFVGCQFDLVRPEFKKTGTDVTGTVHSEYDGYFSTTPHAGLRVFISNKFSINGNVGYKMISGYGNGLSLSLGFAYQIRGLE
jgi:hypothetical protein